MLHDPLDHTLFPTLSSEALEEMREHGTEEVLEPGQAIFEEGQREYDFFVVLDGEIRITKQLAGDEHLLAVHQPGEFAGEISLLTGAPAIATARATKQSRVLRIPADTFRRLVAECTPLAETALAALAGRNKDVDVQLRQQDKLAALGRMAAGLAHELNNPASAITRAANQLGEGIARMQKAALDLHSQPMPREQGEFLTDLAKEATATTCTLNAHPDPLAQSDREEALGEWLDERGVDDAWCVAPTLAAAGLDPERLAEVEAQIGADTLPAAVRWLEASLAAGELVHEIERSGQRISELVGTIKKYSHMDRAPVREEIDVQDGLESTLAMLKPKLKHGVELVREFADGLPRICAYGGELNQVWTNLIDNAADAMDGKGRITLRTSRRDDHIVVEVEDDGPGIPDAILSNIWEPFFTTKGVGKGTGLGLDIVRRIVKHRHGGDIRVRSRPGQTRFEVTLPIDARTGKDKTAHPTSGKPSKTEPAAEK